jgi:membrane protease YdiL (CAAX protease family)
LNKLLRNDKGQLRNGWWILLFAAIFVASQMVYRPVSHGLQHLGVDKKWLGPLPVVFVVTITWICLRLRRQGLADVGLRLDAAWLRQVAGGFAFGAVEMLALVAMIWLAGGVRFELDPARGLGVLAFGLWSFAWAALVEELLFRGFVFQRLVDGIGAPAAMLLMAAGFAAAHWGNPGMEGATTVAAMVDMALGAILLGLAWLRTRSLALPVGIHLGWNWTQGTLLGFGVSGFAQPGWLHPQLLPLPQWLTGGAFGPEASVFSVAVDVIAIALLWRWKGVTNRPRAARLPIAEAA